MAAFVNQLETVTLHAPTWENYETVVVKKKMSMADEEWISNQFTKLKSNGELDASLGSVKLKTLVRMIVSWTFAENGQPMPVNEQNVGRLAKEYADYIYENINSNNQPMTAQEQESFLTPAAPSIAEESVTNS